jgi:hypothetical protein
MPLYLSFYTAEVSGDHHKTAENYITTHEETKYPSHKIIMHDILTPPPFLLVIAT